MFSNSFVNENVVNPTYFAVREMDIQIIEVDTQIISVIMIQLQRSEFTPSYSQSWDIVMEFAFALFSGHNIYF